MTNKKETKEAIEYEYAFSILKKPDGNLGVQPFRDGESVNTEQVYQACDTIVRNMQSQDIAQHVANLLVHTASQAQAQESSLVVPSHLKRVK